MLNISIKLDSYVDLNPKATCQSQRGGFLVRFSPNETGEWSYIVSVTDRNGNTSSEARTFKVIPSAFHGPIRIGQNKRYLEQADGTPWFGIGLWYNGDNDTNVLDELRRKGANFISRFITPLETPKLSRAGQKTLD